MNDGDGKIIRELRDAAHDLTMQMYGALRHGSHRPTRMQWMRLASALDACGAKMPDDAVKVFAQEDQLITRLREAEKQIEARDRYEQALGEGAGL